MKLLFTWDVNHIDSVLNYIKSATTRFQFDLIQEPAITIR